MEEGISGRVMASTLPIVPKNKWIILALLVLSSATIIPAQHLLSIPDTVSNQEWQNWSAKQQGNYLLQWDTIAKNFLQVIELKIERELAQIQDDVTAEKAAFILDKAARLDSLERLFAMQFEQLSSQEEQSFFKEKKYQARDELQAKYDEARDVFERSWIEKEESMLNALHQVELEKAALLNRLLTQELTWLEQYRNRLTELQKHF